MKLTTPRESFWYFAIGAMMNPVSLSNRNIVPIESVPGELLDHKLVFFGAMGLGSAMYSKGDSFHGVLHLVDKDTMESLDKIEIEYFRKSAKARLYDGKVVDVTVYIKPDHFERGKDHPPSERYMEILISGARHFGVQEDYIDKLRKHEMTPRPLPSEFAKFPDDEPTKTMSLDQVLQKDGSDGTFRFTLNSKVLEVSAEHGSQVWKDANAFYEPYGHHIEMGISRVVYEPKYGMPKHLADFTREHSAWAEDTAVRFWKSSNRIKDYKVVARYEQQYAD